MRVRTPAADWTDTRSLGSAATRGALVTAMTSWSRFLLQLVTLVVVARIIGPSEYGAAATALVAVTGAELVRSGGVTWLIARAPGLSGASASTLHWISVGAGCAIALALLTATPFVAADLLPAGALTFPALAFVFVLAGVGAVPTALLGRNLRLLPIGLGEVTAAAVSCAAAVTAALLGAGSASLILQAVVYAAVLCGIVLVVTPWRPSRPAPLRAVRGELAFAGSATLSQGLEWVSRSVDRVVVTALFGTAASGLYVQAAQLSTLPVEQVNGPLRRAAVPALGRLVDDPARFRPAYRSVLTLSCAVLWPVFAVLIVLAEPVVVTLFGSEWLATAPIFRAMAPLAMATVVTGVTTFVALAHGLANRQTLWECAVLRPVTIAGFAVGAIWGVTGVAAGYSVSTALLVVPGFLFIAKRADLGLRDLLAPLTAPATVAVACAAAAAVVQAVASTSPLLTVVVAGGASAVVWLAGLAAFPSTRHLLLRLRAVVPARRAVATVPVPQD